MFGTIGIEAVQPQVEAYFVDLYPEALRFESVLNGNVPMPENRKKLRLRLTLQSNTKTYEHFLKA